MTTKSKLIWAVAVIVAIPALWFGYWWVALHGANNQYNVNTHTQQYQAGLVQQLRDKVQGYELATDPAQKANFAQTICSMYVDLTQPPQDLVEAHAQICN